MLYMSKKMGKQQLAPQGTPWLEPIYNQLGLPASAIIYITGAPPEGMQWLNFADARHYGIDVSPFNLSVGATAAQSSAPRETFSSQVSSVRNEVYQFVDATNHPADLALSYLDGKYLDQVNYYGKISPKSSVLSDKRAFFRRWPVRNYSIQPASVSVTCETTSKCQAEGIIDWAASGDILSSKGSATFSLLWVLEGKIWKIASERSQPVERKVVR